MNIIRFVGKQRDCNGMRYSWIAHTKEIEPKTIYINKHKAWLTKNEKYLDHLVLIIMSHEQIHQILWRLRLDGKTHYDLIRYRFLKKLGKKLKHELREII